MRPRLYGCDRTLTSSLFITIFKAGGTGWEAGPTTAGSRDYMQGTIVQVNISPGGLPKRAIADGFITPLGIEGDLHAHPAIHGGAPQAPPQNTVSGGRWAC